MWQEIAVCLILALGAGFTLWSFYGKFTGKSTGCGGGCTCKGAAGMRAGATCAGGKKPGPAKTVRNGAHRCTAANC